MDALLQFLQCSIIACRQEVLHNYNPGCNLFYHNIIGNKIAYRQRFIIFTPNLFICANFLKYY